MSRVKDVIDYMVTNPGHLRHGSIRVAFYVGSGKGILG